MFVCMPLRAHHELQAHRSLESVVHRFRLLEGVFRFDAAVLAAQLCRETVYIACLPGQRRCAGAADVADQDLDV